MKKISFKLFISVAFLSTFVIKAQEEKRSFKEEFKVNSDVLINIDTRHADVEVETWKKNKVVVEAFMMVEGEDITNEIRDNFYKNWDFKAYGNKSDVKISSKSKNRININTFDFDSPDYSYFLNKNDFKIHIPDVSIINLDILDSVDFEEPLPPMPPEVPRVIRLPRHPNGPSQFNFKAYKKDKNYLKKWKKENEEIIGENAKVTIGKNSISIKSDDKTSNYCWKFCTDDNENANQISQRIKIAMKKLEVETEKHNKERRKRLELRREAIVKRNKNLAKRIKELQARRKEIQHALKNRCNLKIKRFIKVKAPESAKFKMNVKYGTVSFPK